MAALDRPRMMTPMAEVVGGGASTEAGSGRANKNLVLAAMVFAVAMTFIDQTIVAIAIPSIQKELSLTATGSQWIINGYLLVAVGAVRVRRQARRRARAGGGWS